MGTSALKSTAITNLDASPPLVSTEGEGAPGYLRSVEGFITTVAADAAGSTYRLVRLPSNAKVKEVVFRAAAQGAGKVQLSAYYSDSATDGTQPSLQGLVVPTNGAAFFAGDIDCASAVTPADYLGTGSSVVWTIDKWNKQLWDALGIASDPGGFIDLVAVVHTTDITTGAALLGVSVRYSAN